MSKECEDCKYFEGWSWDDGMPICTHEDESGNKGAEYCPYNDQAMIRNKGMKIEIDSGFMSDYIRHTIENTIENNAYNIACSEVKRIIDDQMKESIRQKVNKKIDEKINSVIDRAFDEFLDGSILVGGSFLSEAETMTRRQYISKEIEKKLKSIDLGRIKTTAESEARTQIDKFAKDLQNRINLNIKTYFDEATRQTLTENVVSMLMCNDTYKKLSDSMGRLLPQGNK